MKYLAKFSTGHSKAIAKSTRQYSAAWLAIGLYNEGEAIQGHNYNGQNCRIFMGFARTRELAAKAIATETAIFRTGLYCGRTSPHFQPHQLVHQEIIDIEPE